MKKFDFVNKVKPLAIMMAVVGSIGALTLVSGVVPVNASSGHWAITKWLLDFASDRSVDFHSDGIKVPDLNEPGLVELGASTYEQNCSFCHGRPGVNQPPVARGMTPTPPYLAGSLEGKKSRELFYIVKHGIKFAGMPAWPTPNNDDEIWPVIAFLDKIRSLDAAEYRRLIRIAEQPSLYERCQACHGDEHMSPVSKRVPALSGQNETYLRNSLLAYRDATRSSGIMMQATHGLTDEQIDRLARLYSSQKPAPQRETNAKLQHEIDEGRRLAQRGDRQQKIPSCVDCHGPNQPTQNPEYPSLAGQSARYIEQQLYRFARRGRGGLASAKLMHPIADKLNSAQRRSLAAYYASIVRDETKNDWQ
tara:strand:+ start:94337 stop:95425 length:1089 start_codon:yes stop_codon:yes gene_type:complete